MTRSVTDKPERERFEIRDGDELLGFVAYRRRPGLVALIHTETAEGHEGEGVAGELVRTVLDRLRRAREAIVHLAVWGSRARVASRACLTTTSDTC